MEATYLTPLLISLKTVLATTAITFFLGIAVARWVVRYGGRLGNFLDGLFLLPLVLPPTAVGLGLLMLFGVHGPIGKLLLLFGTKIVFSWTATVIAATVMTFPLMYMTARGAFEQVDEYENVARTLGASEWRVSGRLRSHWPGRGWRPVPSFRSPHGWRVWRHPDAGRLPSRPDWDGFDGYLFCL